jgi:hypothetical protein
MRLFLSGLSIVVLSLSASLTGSSAFASHTGDASSSETDFKVPYAYHPEPLRSDISRKIVEELIAEASKDPAFERRLREGIGITPQIPLEDGASVLDFCHEPAWSKACLFGLIAYRCNQYTFPAGATGCSLAAATFVDIIDLKRIDVTLEGETYNLPLIFARKLEQMIQTPSIQAEIRDLNLKLRYAAATKKTFRLWDWALSIRNQNREKATEWLSILLQDTSLVQIHIAYLRQIADARRFSPEARQATETLSRICLFIFETTQSPENATAFHSWGGKKRPAWLRLYPNDSIEADTTPLVYHLYPMAHIAQDLKKRGHNERLSSFIPYLFNAEYVLHDLDMERWPFRHPRASMIDLNDARVQWKMRDLYGGLVGGQLGVGKLNKAIGLERYQKMFARDPYSTSRYLFWRMPTP